MDLYAPTMPPTVVGATLAVAPESTIAAAPESTIAAAAESTIAAAAAAQSGVAVGPSVCMGFDFGGGGGGGGGRGRGEPCPYGIVQYNNPVHVIGHYLK